MAEDPPVLQDAPLTEVRASVEGLRGASRAAALAAAEAARGAPSLAALDAVLRDAAPELGVVGARSGEPIAVEVSPGAAHGCVCVAFRPQASWRVATAGGFDARMDSAVGVDGEFAQLGGPEGAQVRFGCRGHLGLSRGVTAALRVAPLRLPTPGALLPVGFLEKSGLPAGGFGLPGLASGPGQQAVRVGVCLEEPSGRHAVRFEAAHRDLLPGSEVSRESLRHQAFKSVKTSVSYNFLDESRPEPDAATGGVSRATVELAGGMGDVALARAEGAWTRAWRRLGCIFSLTASGGAVVPLNEKGTVPWVEERLLLGGAAGSCGERLPGFAPDGVSPPSACAPAPAAPAAPAEGLAFGPGWETVRHVGDPGAGASAVGEETPRAAGDAGWTARTSLSAAVQVPLFPLPFSGGGLRAHGFAHCTAAALVGQARPGAAEVAQQARASVGLGLGVPLQGGGFAGLTWSRPFLARHGDKLQPLQVSLSFGRAL